MLTSREAFEQWYRAEREGMYEPFERVVSDERYTSMETEWAYRAYVAACQYKDEQLQELDSILRPANPETPHAGDMKLSLEALLREHKAYAEHIDLLEAQIAELEAQRVPEWQPIETAPKDGTEILGWRDDCGVILVRWTSCEAFMTDNELEESGLDEDAISAEDWFYADFIAGGRLDGSEVPTLWMPLPPAPTGDSDE